MDLIIKSPGLQHIAEAMFSNLTKEDEFSKCQEVNTFLKSILNGPTFWLKKCSERGLSHQYYLEWSRLIQQPKYAKIHEDVIFYLQKMYFLTETFLPPIQMAFICLLQPLEDKNKDHNSFGLADKLDLIKMIAPLSESANASFPNGDYFGYSFGGYTPIQKAVDISWNYPKKSKQCIEIIKTLAPLSDNPDCPGPTGFTPLYHAVQKGHLEIIKILAPLSNNPNAPVANGCTPIYLAVEKGHLEIIKILAPLSDNPNAPVVNGFTPIYLAAEKGYSRVSNKSPYQIVI